MKFSESWLREFIDPPITSQQLVDQLTMAGLEVEETIPYKAEHSGVTTNDTIIDLSITPNRGDCLSLTGIAREVAVLNNLKFRSRRSRSVKSQSSSVRNIRLQEPQACPRYLGRIIDNIDTSKSAPSWVTERLKCSGINSVNAIVDLTNYVMLELGQPMHVFDNAKLQGDIVVRLAEPNEKIQLLDGQNLTLNDNTLVIADSNVAIAIAGIMGNQQSAVTDSTQSVFIECAFFAPEALQGRARQYGLQTDASYRYERGVDPSLLHMAMERLTRLIIDHCGGSAGQVIENFDSSWSPPDRSILLSHDQLTRVLGIEIAARQVMQILKNLGFVVTAGKKSWSVKVPSYRFDISIEADLIEEIARIYGYQNIPNRTPRIKARMTSITGPTAQMPQMATVLQNRGFYEVINYSFVDPILQSLLSESADKDLELINPTSTDMAVMRRSLWPGLIQSLMFNINRQQSRVRLFETGNVFTHEGRQHPAIAGVVFGKTCPDQWGKDDKQGDFYDHKSDVEALLMPYCYENDLEFQFQGHAALQQGQTAAIILEKIKIGVIGTLDPTVQNQLGIQQPAYLFELDLSLISPKKGLKFTKVSKFPSISRDISVIVDTKISVNEVMIAVKSVASEWLHNLELFDLYQGEGIDLEKKSLALGLTFQRSSSTLTDGEIDEVIDRILYTLQEQFGAILR